MVEGGRRVVAASGGRHARESEHKEVRAARVPSEAEARRAGAERPPGTSIAPPAPRRAQSIGPGFLSPGPCIVAGIRPW
jgi:hypothetical protein